MKPRLLHCALLLAGVLVGGASGGQDPPGAMPKKPRTPDDYRPRTLKEIAAAGSDARGRDAAKNRDKENATVVYGDLLPSRVRVTYAGSARPLPRGKQDVIARWARRYAGSPEHYTESYETEMLFREDGARHWLAVNKRLLPKFEKELKEGDAVDLCVIRLGGVRTAGEWESVLLVETFIKPE